MICFDGCNVAFLPEDEDNGGDNFNGESHEISSTNDLKDRESHTDEDKETEFDLKSILLLNIDFSPNDGVCNEEKADKGDHCEGEPHVANQLSPNDL